MLATVALQSTGPSGRHVDHLTSDRGTGGGDLRRSDPIGAKGAPMYLCPRHEGAGIRMSTRYVRLQAEVVREVSVTSWSMGGSTSSSASKRLCLRWPGSDLPPIGGGWCGAGGGGRYSVLRNCKVAGRSSWSCISLPQRVVLRCRNCSEGPFRIARDSRMALVLGRNAGSRKGAIKG